MLSSRFGEQRRVPVWFTLNESGFANLLIRMHGAVPRLRRDQLMGFCSKSFHAARLGQYFLLPTGF